MKIRSFFEKGKRNISVEIIGILESILFSKWMGLRAWPVHLVLSGFAVDCICGGIVYL
jgi:hypothetical protein